MSARLVGGFAYTVRVCTNIKDAACPGSRHLDIATFLAEYWTYLTIPAVSAVVGFGTNWLAVKMMMYPVEFKGMGPLGWQGVIPANAKKMAHVVVDHSVKHARCPDQDCAGCSR